MPILALALYGSHARKDSNELSDIDYFAITDDPDYKMLVHGKSNIACYPKQLAFERASNGDLFLLHICTEAKEVYSPTGEFAKLKNSFKYKENYSQEISWASDLAWFLIDTGHKFRNYALLNKRIAWCTRTILIAKSAEFKTPVFSAEKLSELSSLRNTGSLIAGKNSIQFNPDTIKFLIELLKLHGTPRPLINDKNKLLEYSRLFRDSNNTMGLKTLMSTQGDTQSESYT